MNRPIYNPRKLGIDIPDKLYSQDNIDFLDEDDFDDVPTFHSIKEANADNGYVDINREIVTGLTFEESKGPQFFNLSNDSTDDVAKDLVNMVSKTEKEKREEKKAEWHKVLAAMNSRDDEYAVCSNLSGDVIFECLLDTMKNIDEVYTKFTKTPDRHPRHKELLEEIMNDLMEEEKTIEEYKAELKKLG